MAAAEAYGVSGRILSPEATRCVQFAVMAARYVGHDKVERCFAQLHVFGRVFQGPEDETGGWTPDWKSVETGPLFVDAAQIAGGEFVVCVCGFEPGASEPVVLGMTSFPLSRISMEAAMLDEWTGLGPRGEVRILARASLLTGLDTQGRPILSTELPNTVRVHENKRRGRDGGREAAMRGWEPPGYEAGHAESSSGTMPPGYGYSQHGHPQPRESELPPASAAGGHLPLAGDTLAGPASRFQQPQGASSMAVPPAPSMQTTVIPFSPGVSAMVTLPPGTPPTVVPAVASAAASTGAVMNEPLSVVLPGGVAASVVFVQDTSPSTSPYGSASYPLAPPPPHAAYPSQPPYYSPQSYAYDPHARSYHPPPSTTSTGVSQDAAERAPSVVSSRSSASGTRHSGEAPPGMLPTAAAVAAAASRGDALGMTEMGGRGGPGDTLAAIRERRAESDSAMMMRVAMQRRLLTARRAQLAAAAHQQQLHQHHQHQLHHHQQQQHGDGGEQGGGSGDGTIDEHGSESSHSSSALAQALPLGALELGMAPFIAMDATAGAIGGRAAARGGNGREAGGGEGDALSPLGGRWQEGADAGPPTSPGITALSALPPSAAEAILRGSDGGGARNLGLSPRLAALSLLDDHNPVLSSSTGIAHTSAQGGFHAGVLAPPPMTPADSLPAPAISVASDHSRVLSMAPPSSHEALSMSFEASSAALAPASRRRSVTTPAQDRAARAWDRSHGQGYPSVSYHQSDADPPAVGVSEAGPYPSPADIASGAPGLPALGMTPQLGNLMPLGADGRLPQHQHGPLPSPPASAHSMHLPHSHWATMPTRSRALTSASAYTFAPSSGTGQPSLHSE